MSDISPEIRELLKQYDGDTKAILKEYPRLDYLYALADMRENVLEWFDFDENGDLLQIGSDYGALTGLYARRVRSVTVIDPYKGNLELNRLRHREYDNIAYVEGSLDSYVEGRGEVKCRDDEEERVGEEDRGDVEYCGNGKFDYVMMIGSLEAPYAAQIEKAKSLLKPGGKLIVAVCNRLGLKYKAGALPEETALLKSELAELLCGGGENPDGSFKRSGLQAGSPAASGLECGGPEAGRLKFYYPMPDYRLPMTIYSEDYLPSKGDLSQAILAYDYPVYLRFDLGKMFDEVCEEKQFETFANSYLVVWSKL